MPTWTTRHPRLEEGEWARNRNLLSRSSSNRKSKELYGTAWPKNPSWANFHRCLKFVRSLDSPPTRFWTRGPQGGTWTFERYRKRFSTEPSPSPARARADAVQVEVCIEIPKAVVRSVLSVTGDHPHFKRFECRSLSQYLLVEMSDLAPSELIPNTPSPEATPQ